MAENTAVKTSLAALPLVVALMGHVTSTGSQGTIGASVRVANTAGVPELSSGDLDGDDLVSISSNLPFGAPKSSVPSAISFIVRDGYILAHNNADRIADWVAYRVTKEQAVAEKIRAGDPFKADPKLRRGNRAELEDYAGWRNVFDRGHQMPAGAASGLGKPIVRESFHLSNMTPQTASLNRGQWRSLEGKVLDWASAREQVWVITGPAFIDDDGDGLVEYAVIGDNQVAVPTHYFKIVYSLHDNDPVDVMAFLIPNIKINDFRNHLVSIDRVEEVTGLDFFADLDQHFEIALEEKELDQVWSTN